MKRVALAALCFLAASPAHAATQIHWTIKGQTAITVNWVGSETKVYYSTVKGRVATLQGGIDSVTAGSPSHAPWNEAGPFPEARVTGLTENTIYYYRIGTAGDSNVVVHTFRTPPPRGSSNFTIVVVGDMGDTTKYEEAGAVNTQIMQQNPRLVLLVGDLTYANSYSVANSAAASNTISQHFNNVMKWSQDAAYMPAWGNHEWDKCADTAYYQDDLRNYKGRFDLPNARESPGVNATNSSSCAGKNNGGEDWYWFDYGNTRFIAYPEPFSGAVSAWQLSADSLMNAVRNDPQIQFIVTFGHRQPYSSGSHEADGNSTLGGKLSLLANAHPKYRLNVYGHSHNYERTVPINDKVTHITSGGGGSLYDGSQYACGWRYCPQPTWSAYRAYRLGVTVLDFQSDRIIGRQLCGPTDDDFAGVQLSCTLGTEIDAFTVVPFDCACAPAN